MIWLVMSIFGFVTPHFVWGIFFILVFALYLKWLPTGGWEGPLYWVLPVLAYAPGSRISKLPDETIGKLNQLIRQWIHAHKGKDRASI